MLAALPHLQPQTLALLALLATSSLPSAALCLRIVHMLERAAPAHPPACVLPAFSALLLGAPLQHFGPSAAHQTLPVLRPAQRPPQLHEARAAAAGGLDVAWRRRKAVCGAAASALCSIAQQCPAAWSAVQRAVCALVVGLHAAAALPAWAFQSCQGALALARTARALGVPVAAETARDFKRAIGQACALALELWQQHSVRAPEEDAQGAMVPAAGGAWLCWPPPQRSPRAGDVLDDVIELAAADCAVGAAMLRAFEERLRVYAGARAPLGLASDTTGHSAAVDEPVSRESSVYENLRVERHGKACIYAALTAVTGVIQTSTPAHLAALRVACEEACSALGVAANVVFGADNVLGILQQECRKVVARLDGLVGVQTGPA